MVHCRRMRADGAVVELSNVGAVAGGVDGSVRGGESGVEGGGGM